MTMHTNMPYAIYRLQRRSLR